MMSGFRRIEIHEPSPSFFVRETSIFRPKTLLFPTFAEEVELDFALNLLNPSPFDLSLQCFSPPASSTFEVFDTVTDLIQFEKTPLSSSYRRLQQRTGADRCLRSLCDRVSALELGFNRVVNAKINDLDRKYSWTTEIKSPEKNAVDRKYKWSVDIKGGKKNGAVEKTYKWTAKGKDKEAPISHTYSLKVSTSPAEECSGSKKDKKKCSKGSTAKRAVEIEEPVEQGAVVLRQAFAKRGGAVENGKGKKKELSPQDAALMIQMTFRAYLIRRSQALRGLRELAVAKAKLKEIRALFNNFSYRRRIAHDAEERQRFSERAIVILLTVDAIEGADIMVRAARKSMVDELEAMLDVVDPQPPEKLGSIKRRNFDLPEGGIQKEIAAGVAEVVQLLDQDERNGSNSFEVCL
ncbi:hypothetical protein HHK36_028691 [Tetracentron sinense]|uniref:BAG domain-containing protein n=1 Tax=Tetracentron sinense TaxID=13715 RepID=A0A835D3N7_TETSI|nr:hypothetical protein HHK36_028691 [Tetracentron sinense]